MLDDTGLRSALRVSEGTSEPTFVHVAFTFSFSEAWVFQVKQWPRECSWWGRVLFPRVLHEKINVCRLNGLKLWTRSRALAMHAPPWGRVGEACPAPTTRGLPERDHALCRVRETFPRKIARLFPEPPRLPQDLSSVLCPFHWICDLSGLLGRHALAWEGWKCNNGCDY